jgi:hypothetical protein
VNLEWCRRRPMLVRNALFVLCAVPLAALARRYVATHDATSATMGAVLPIIAIGAGMVIAKLIADRLRIPRR